MLENNSNIEKCVPIVPQVGGWLQAKLSEECMSKLWKYIEIGGENSRDKLAGNISESFLLTDTKDWFWINVVQDLVMEYEKKFGTLYKKLSVHTTPYCMTDFWANKSKQTEFNPLHDHSGVYSFVIWMKIPTDYREQHELPICKGTNSPSASDFTLLYHDIVGKMKTHPYNLDKSMEGTIILFPAQGIPHTVYPFYNCDEERVSISGNIFFDTNCVTTAPVVTSHSNQDKYVVPKIEGFDPETMMPPEFRDIITFSDEDLDG